MAAALFSNAYKKEEEFVVRSAGTAVFSNTSATPNAVAAAAALGAVCVSHHKSQPATPELLAEVDLIICLAAGHVLQAAQHVPPAKLRVLGGGVADPFGGSLENYHACAAQINAALPSLLPDIHCKAQIIPTEESHLPAIAQLEREVFTPPASEAKLHEKLNLDTCRMLTALLNSEAAGFIIVDEIAGEAFIDDLAVFPAYQRQGIASALLGQAEVGAILRGCPKIHLEVRESNTPARTLYEARGYQQVGRRKNFYQNPTEDAILYTLEFR